MYYFCKSTPRLFWGTCIYCWLSVNTHVVCVAESWQSVAAQFVQCQQRFSVGISPNTNLMYVDWDAITIILHCDYKQLTLPLYIVFQTLYIDCPGRLFCVPQSCAFTLFIVDPVIPESCAFTLFIVEGNYCNVSASTPRSVTLTRSMCMCAHWRTCLHVCLYFCMYFPSSWSRAYIGDHDFPIHSKRWQKSLLQKDLQ